MIPVAGHHIMSIERWRASPASRTIVMCMPLRACPTSPAMIPRSIRTNLNRLRRRERLLALAWGAACWLAIVLIFLLAACFVDWLIDREIDTPWSVRALLFALQIGLAIVVGWLFLVRPQIRRLRDDTLALWVEDRHPAFAHRLITAVQLSRPGAKSEGMSPELIAVVVSEAEKRSAALDFTHVADHRRLRRAALLAGPVLVVAILTAILQPQLAAVLLSRLFLADIDIPHSVAIEPLRRDEVRPAGERVAL